MDMRKAPRTCVAFGVPVSLEMLGARLEAYTECRAALIALEGCIQHLPRLPPEVWQMIFEVFRESTYEEYLEWWKTANRCCKHICEYTHDDEYENYGTWEKHNERVEDLMAKLGQRDYTNHFNKSRKVCVTVM